MSDKEKTIINYIVICISEFAKQKLITTKEAYNYLKEYNGLEFLIEFFSRRYNTRYNCVFSRRL